MVFTARDGGNSFLKSCSFFLFRCLSSSQLFLEFLLHTSSLAMNPFVYLCQKSFIYCFRGNLFILLCQLKWELLLCFSPGSLPQGILKCPESNIMMKVWDFTTYLLTPHTAFQSDILDNTYHNFNCKILNHLGICYHQNPLFPFELLQNWNEAVILKQLAYT